MSISDVLKQNRIIPVIKIDNVEDTLPLLRGIKEGGIKIAEITYRTACAKEAITLAIQNFDDMIIGAGTIINVNQAIEAISLGVKFVVSPGLDEETAKYCREKNVPYFPGCISPTEIMKAINLGIEIVKFFPAENYGGLKTIKSLSAPFPQLRFMPTGGININNLKEYLSFEKIVACGGSWMVKGDLIKNKKFDKIKELSREAVEEANRV